MVGWFSFAAAAVGQTVVPLTGAYYAAGALGAGRALTFGLAAALLAVAVAANLRGLRLSGRVQIALSGGVALVLLAATLAALPRVRLEAFTPFFPHGLRPVGEVAVLLFFAFFGWEAIAQLAAEFRDPARDVPRSTVISAGVVTTLYVGIAVAVVGSGTYGDPAVDRVAVGRLLADVVGVGAGTATGLAAVLISLGTANAFVAATARLGYALARDGAFPRRLAQLDAQGVPRAAVLAVGTIAAAGLALAYARDWGAEHLLGVPNSLGIATYVIGTAAGVRLLRGRARALALIALLSCLVVLPFAGASVAFPLGVAVAAIGYRRRWGRGPAPAATPEPGGRARHPGAAALGRLAIIERRRPRHALARRPSPPKEPAMVQSLADLESLLPTMICPDCYHTELEAVLRCDLDRRSCLAAIHCLRCGHTIDPDHYRGEIAAIERRLQTGQVTAACPTCGNRHPAVEFRCELASRECSYVLRCGLCNSVHRVSL
ncbi:MAG: APC family permease [Sphaerobacter sp.]|nr:APC family permease [Sphaerobacter sp.]